MNILIATSERLAGGFLRPLEQAGHRVVGIVSPARGVYTHQFRKKRYRFLNWLGWDILRASRKRQVELRIAKHLEDGAIKAFIRNSEADLLLVFGWPSLIPESVIQLFPQGGVNIHPSLLPSLRGPDPLFVMIKDFKADFGLTFHQLTEELDSGPIYLQIPLELHPKDHYDRLYLKTLRAIRTYLPMACNAIARGETGYEQRGTASLAKRFRLRDRILDIHDDPAHQQRLALACFSHHERIGSVNGSLFLFRHFKAYRKPIETGPLGTVLKLGLASVIVQGTDGPFQLRGIRFPGFSATFSKLLLPLRLKAGVRLDERAMTTRSFRDYRKAGKAI